MLKKRIPLVTGSSMTVDFVSPDLIAHVNDGRNYVDSIIGQLAHEYGDLFRRNNLDTVLDIGANIGLFSVYMSPICRQVYAVEPTPSHFALLKEVTQDVPNITPVNMALSDRCGEVDFFISNENSTMNTLVQQLNDVYDQSVKVKGVDIKGLLDELELDHVDLIKLDIEGSESVCVTETLVSQVRSRVDSWFVECHGNPVGGSWQQVFHDIKAILDKCGYAVYHVTHDGILAIPHGWPAPRLYNSGLGQLSGDIVIPI